MIENKSIDIEDYIRNLVFSDGIWKSEEHEDISYPKSASDLCFDVENTSFWFRSRNEIIYEAVRQFSIEGPVFDVGGGNGFVSAYLRDKGYQCVLVEPSDDGCKNARGRRIQIINSTFNEKHFLPGKMSNIGIFDVLEHIYNDKNFLSIIYKMLIPGGRLFITVPSSMLLWSAEDNDAGHYRRYSRHGLRKKVGEQGFRILYQTYFFSYLVLPILMFRVIPTKLGLYKGKPEKFKKHLTIKFFDKILIKPATEFERNQVMKLNKLFFGSSLLVVAEKI